MFSYTASVALALLVEMPCSRLLVVLTSSKKTRVQGTEGVTSRDEEVDKVDLRHQQTDDNLNDEGKLKEPVVAKRKISVGGISSEDIQPIPPFIRKPRPRKVEVLSREGKQESEFLASPAGKRLKQPLSRALSLQLGPCGEAMSRFRGM